MPLITNHPLTALDLNLLGFCSQTELLADNQTESVQEDVVEKFEEDTVKPKVKKKKKRKEGTTSDLYICVGEKYIVESWRNMQLSCQTNVSICSV